MAEKITVSVDIDPEILAFSLAHSMNRKELYRLIVDLDEAVSEYDFTEKLRDHFAEIIRKEDEVIERENQGTIADG